uniref:Putative serine protease do-like protein n=1 Tax=Aegilops tauschii TaxID=37682 RepID=N1QPU5_AEGTA
MTIVAEAAYCKLLTMAADTAVTGSLEQSKMTHGGDDVEGQEEIRERETKRMKTNPASVEAAASDDDDGDEELEISSPLCEPYIPDELKDPYRYPGVSAAYDVAEAEFSEKQGRLDNLPTRQYFDWPVLRVRDPGRKAALSAARSLLRLSSSLVAGAFGRSMIDSGDASGTGIVLTSANLIRANKPLAKDHRGRKDRYEYHPGAQVTVHLLDDTTAEGRLLYHQEHYDIALFKVEVDHRVQLASFADTVDDGQEVLRLGRKEDFNLKITRGVVDFRNPELDEGHHYMYFSRDNKYVENDERHGKNVWMARGKGPYIRPKCDDGGDPVIDIAGKVVGMTNRCGSWYFVPSSILNGCIDLWRNFGCIPWPLLGLQFEAIKFLDPTHAEYIWRKLNIDDGLVVEEVSTASHAEEVGIRVGDIIQYINGERISTTTELENKLLSICRGNFDRGTDINAKVDVSVRVFHTANRLWRTQHLTINVSGHREVVERAYYPITNGEEVFAQVKLMESTKLGGKQFMVDVACD